MWSSRRAICRRSRAPPQRYGSRREVPGKLTEIGGQVVRERESRRAAGFTLRVRLSDYPKSEVTLSPTNNRSAKDRCRVTRTVHTRGDRSTGSKGTASAAMPPRKTWKWFLFAVILTIAVDSSFLLAQRRSRCPTRSLRKRFIEATSRRSTARVRRSLAILIAGKLPATSDERYEKRIQRRIQKGDRLHTNCRPSWIPVWKRS